MKKCFFLAIMLAAAARLGAADGDWVAGELEAATREFEQRRFPLAHDIYRNLLVAHQAAPLNASALAQARDGMAVTARQLRGDEQKGLGAAFVERVQRLGYVQVGPAWLPPAVKAHLPADATAKLARLGQGKVCLACKGAGVCVCPNCVAGVARCISCSGTGRAGGSPITSRGAPCPFCDGRGKAKCVLCKGSGYGICPKCDGTGLLE
jgi:hypothetical protein